MTEIRPSLLQDSRLTREKFNVLEDGWVFNCNCEGFKTVLGSSEILGRDHNFLLERTWGGLTRSEPSIANSLKMNPGNSEDRPRCIRILEIVILVDAFKDTEKNVAILMIEHKLFHQSRKVIISHLVLRRISLAVGDFKGMGFIGIGSCSKEFVLFGQTFLFLWIVL